MESAKGRILGSSKRSSHPSTHVNLHDATLGDIIKDISHKFDFGDTNNETSNIDTTGKDNSPHGSINGAIIITNIYQRDKIYPADIQKVLSIPNKPSTQQRKEINIDGKLYCQDITSFIYASNPNLTH